MTISSGEPELLRRGLDSMLVVYSVVEDHSAGPTLERFLQGHSGWFVVPGIVFDVYTVLTKVYGTDAGRARAVLAEFLSGPVHVLPTDGADALAAMALSAAQGVDLTDALLLHACGKLGASRIATDDGRLSAVATAQCLVVENPIDAGLRRLVAEWEEAHLPAKGLPRVLHTIGYWLAGLSPDVAVTFRNATGGHSHLP